MKKILILALFISSGLALAADNKCLAGCKEMAEECTNQCVKNVKKKNAAAMPQCSSQCKALVSECEKECADEGSKKR